METLQILYTSIIVCIVLAVLYTGNEGGGGPKPPALTHDNNNES